MGQVVLSTLLSEKRNNMVTELQSFNSTFKGGEFIYINEVWQERVRGGAGCS